MANSWYNEFKDKIGNPGTLGTTSGTSVRLLDDDIRVALIDTGVYTFSASHEFYSSVSGVVGTPQLLASKTLVNGVFDAADVTFTALSGATVEAYIIYKDTGTAGTSPLIAYFDTASAGLPLTPNGGNVTLAFNASGIFAL
jgi:hypothetical protein